MEQDRYEQNHVLFIVGLISLISCLGLLLFTLFMLPHLVFGWHYAVPEFISYFREWIVSTYGLNISQARLVVFGILSTLVLLSGYISYYASTQIDDKLYTLKTPIVEDPPKSTKKLSQSTKESIRYFLIVLGVIIIVFSSTVGFHWMISIF